MNAVEIIDCETEDFSQREAAEAQKMSEEGHVRGKIVLRIST